MTEQEWIEKQTDAVKSVLQDATIFYPEYCDAIVGIARLPIMGTDALATVLVYDIDKVVDILTASSPGLPRDDAEEFIAFNMVGGWLGPFTPIHMYRTNAEEWTDTYTDTPYPNGMFGMGTRCGQRELVLFESGKTIPWTALGSDELDTCVVIKTQ